jgi:hypothetical protein
MHNEELHNFFSPNVIRMNNKTRVNREEHSVGMGDNINVYSVVVGNPKEKTLFRRPRHKLKDNIKKIFIKVNMML